MKSLTSKLHKLLVNRYINNLCTTTQPFFSSLFSLETSNFCIDIIKPSSINSDMFIDDIIDLNQLIDMKE